jgi:P27 family predicted phage terminase small subunit
LERRGKMSRSRKPLVMQKGNLTVLQQTNRQLEEQSIVTGREQLDNTPSWLVDDVAEAEFKRLITELNSINAVGNLDLNNIGCYCNAYSMYLKATKELMEQPLTLERYTNTGTIIVSNPLIGIQKKYAEEMRKFASLCGLTIDSRLKVATVKANKEQDEINRKFGGI